MGNAVVVGKEARDVGRGAGVAKERASEDDLEGGVDLAISLSLSLSLSLFVEW